MNHFKMKKGTLLCHEKYCKVNYISSETKETIKRKMKSFQLIPFISRTWAVNPGNSDCDFSVNIDRSFSFDLSI